MGGKMKLVVQKVKNASVTSEGTVTGKINKGYMVLVGIKTTDTKAEADYLAKKLINLRIFEDENDKMNLSIKDVGGELLLVSQFTLYGDATQGNRPSFIEAARPEQANELYEYFCNQCAKEIKVEKGVFQTHMEVSLVNDGPVTIILEK
jgi:D-tyrosyl-tRNA(Tyr) deacylase